MKAFTLCIALLVVLLMPLPSKAQPSWLDKNFGNNGVVVTQVKPLTGYYSGADDIVIQPDGKLVVAGWSANPSHQKTLVVARYHASGQLDSSFGGTGFVFPSTERITLDVSVKLQSSGKIIVLAQTYASVSADTLPMLAIRLAINGQVDSTFGYNGSARFASSLVPLSNLFKPRIVAVDSNRVLVGFQHGGGWGLLRFLESGKIDSSFGLNGSVAYGHVGASSYRTAVLLPDGKIVVPYGYGLHNFTITRLTNDGKTDYSFGQYGQKSVSIPTSLSFVNSHWGVAIQNDGKILLTSLCYVASGVTDYAIIRVNGDGTVDSTFGQKGMVITHLTNDNDEPRNLHVLPNGSILWTGLIYCMGATFNKVAMACYLPSGKLDQTFGKKGAFHMPLPGNEGYVKNSIVQPDGSTVFVGANDFYGNFTLLRFKTGEPYKYNELIPQVFVDKDGDNQMNGADVALKNSTLKVQAGTGDSMNVFSSSGEFSIDVDTGSFVTSGVTQIPHYNWTISSHASIFMNYGNQDSFKLAVVPIPGQRDISINLQALQVPRPGFAVTYSLGYKNIGTDTASNVIIKVKKDYRLVFDSASKAPSFIQGDSLAFNIGNLHPLDDSSIYLHFRVAFPPIANANDTLVNVANIYPTASDLNLSNNTVNHRQVVRNSCDPNDKTEAHAGRLYHDEYLAGEMLQYMIRFQNTGTDTAFNVYIADTLDQRLDWNTLQLLGASHDCQVELSGRNKLRFIFNNIMLPDSNVNEQRSHGYVIFTIKPKAGLTPGTLIRNKADIYFDYNLPVTTNAHNTTLMAQVLPVVLVSFEAKRNGESSLLEWTTSSESNTTRFEIERSSNGVEFNKIGTVAAGLFKYSFSDDQPLTGRNFYRLKIVDNDGKYSYSPVRVVEMNREMFVKVYPNPATGKVTLQVESLKATTASIQLLNVAGMVVKNWEMNLERGVNQSDLSLEGMASGVYFMKINVDGAIEFKRLVVK